ncbi:MAG: tRNA uridine-5-carboxymethylaminomethyl(34) synthesis enzyme MnmG [Candidatus Omnitrophica bacterium]|nr:tRNA uridine-5-carboxymethylaminomethyl(34) synthesis enzyme MnmG [Candidatus Omnitrophota bacterium]
MRRDYDVIVVGAGHAGIEASLSCARMGCVTALCTLRQDTIGAMSCNPAIGGVGKGQLVKEVDALGGAMGEAADNCSIGYRMLNMSKGPAVRSSRCQIDRRLYRDYMTNLIARTENITLHICEVTEIIIKNKKAHGVRTSKGDAIFAKAVIITPGTFLNGLMHIGLKSFPGGRLNETASVSLSENLKKLKFKIKRFKTGTCARIRQETIDFSKCKIQLPDSNPIPFSFAGRPSSLKQLPCFITHTNADTHKIIKKALRFSPLFTGKIKASGVRYCPSIEDKVVKFPHHLRHQIFLEPEGLDKEEYYPNGLSTSLPEKVQIKMFHSIRGLEDAKFSRPGYGIEHEVICATQLHPTLESKNFKNLYLAGQINGTTGYEEAAALGLIAGINAGLKIKARQPFILSRTISYIGVLIDELVSKGTDEPFRMFTSRVEHRLLLREDNADLRLRKFGYELGLVDESDYQSMLEKKKNIAAELDRLRKTKIKPDKRINSILKDIKSTPLKKSISLEELLRRPEITYQKLKYFDFEGKIEDNLYQSINSEVKYAPFVKRQIEEIKRFRNLEKIKIPPRLDFSKISGLSREVKEKLGYFRPSNMAQALRISGVTPASISLLMIWLKKQTKSPDKKCLQTR